MTLHRFSAISLTAALLTSACATEHEGNPIRATLSDGQVFAGSVSTRALQLEGALGSLSIPIQDIGEIVPVEGGALGSSNGHVTVWLRNGSELVGQWAKPELDVDIAVGGQQVPVQLPVNDLQRFQLEDGEHWSNDDVFLVTTTHGDDFLVDPEQTRLTIVNDLGTFEPFLSECVSATPIEDPTGLWRIQLFTGTVLLGELESDQIEFALPMVPDTVQGPLSVFSSLERQTWDATMEINANSSKPIAQGFNQALEKDGRAEEGAYDTSSEKQELSTPGWFSSGGLKKNKRDYRVMNPKTRSR